MPRPRQPKLVRTVPSTLRVTNRASSPTEQESRNLSQVTKDRKVRAGGEKKNGNVIARTSISTSPQTDLTEKRLRGRPARTSAAPIQGARRRSRDLPRALDPSTLGASQDLCEKENIAPHDSRKEPAEQRLQLPGQRPTRRHASGSEGSFMNRPSSSLRQQTTPLGRSSILSGIHFKKRVRQPSLLKVAQSQQDTSVDLDGSAIDDFQPDDESTPLIKSLSKTGQASTSSIGSVNSRKRKLTSPELQITASQSQSGHHDSDPDSSLDLRSSIDQSSGDDDRLEPQLPRLPRTETASPTALSDTHAPPHSSSSPRTDDTGSHSRKRSRYVTQTDKEAPENGAQSSNRNKNISKRSHQSPNRPAPLTTARLQNLLPRRRKRPRQQGTYDVPSSSDVELDASRLGEDEDELSFHAVKKMRQRKSTTKNKSKRAARKAISKNAQSASEIKRASTTYARRSDEDSQVNAEEDSNIQFNDSTLEIDGRTMPVLDAQAKAEMIRLANKFREVDEFTLDFEDVTGSSSQMKDAR